MDLIATKDFRYNTRRLKAGESFQATDRFGKILIAVKKAQLGRSPGKVEKPAPALAKKIADAAGTDIAALRAQYRTKFGKAPFNGWGAQALREKLAAD